MELMTKAPITFVYPFEVIRVIDGDTLFGHADLGFSTKRLEKFRLAHLNCPEMKTTEGKDTKVFVETWVKSQSSLVVQSVKQDKYGRWLAVIWGDNKEYSLNQLLLDSKRALPYM